MGIEDMVNQAKEKLGGDSADAAVDKGADAAKAVAPDQADGAIDKGAQALKDKI